MELSPVEGKYVKYLLKAGLTDEINSRIVYMKGIDRSYEYEEEDSISIFVIEKSMNNIKNENRDFER